MTKPAGLPHMPQLDGVRAIAVSLVFVAHCRLEWIVPGGLGVTIFFFLSGYLITSLLRSEAAQTGRIDLTAFYVRRTARIWPPLYITMAIAIVATLLYLPAQKIDISGIIAQAAFVSNYAPLLGAGAGLVTLPLWSLAVEEHFYLVFPLLFALYLHKLHPSRVALLCAVACVAVLAIRCLLVGRVADLDSLYFWSHTRIDSILFGCCLALWQNPALDERAWRPRPFHLASAVVTLLACLAVRDQVFRETFRYSLQGAALFVIFASLLQSDGRIVRALASRPLRRVGLYSYTLYLVHLLFVWLVWAYLPGLPIVGVMFVAGTASMLYAALMYRWVERPMALLRRSLHRTDRNATVAPD